MAWRASLGVKNSAESLNREKQEHLTVLPILSGLRRFFDLINPIFQGIVVCIISVHLAFKSSGTLVNITNPFNHPEPELLVVFWYPVHVSKGRLYKTAPPRRPIRPES